MLGGPSTDTGSALLGREVELARLRAALARADAAEPTITIISGPPGIGKTRLLAEALAEDERILLFASGDEAEADLDYAIVEQLLRSVPDRFAGRLPPIPKPGADPLRVGAELLQAFDELELERALVVTIDDAQWADHASLQALTFAARRLRADRVLVCVASRSEGVETLPAGLVRVADSTGGRIELAGLDTAAVAALATERLGRPLPERAVRRLSEHTGGNPLHLEALVAELSYAQLDATGPLPVPSSYSALVLGRLAACGPEAERLIAALAVLGAPADLAEVARVAEVGDPLAHAEELVERDLVVLTPAGRSRLEFAHGLVRASVEADLSATRSAALHRRAAEVVAGEEELRHRLAAASAPDPVLVGEAEEAARGAAEAGARRQAARFLLAVAPLAATAGERERFVLGAGSHLLAAGEPLGPLGEEIESFAPSAERDYVRARIALSTGRPEDAERLAGEAWEQLGADSEPRPLVGPLADTLAIVAEHRGDYEDVTAWARRALDAGSESMSSATMLAFGIAMSVSPPAAAAEMRRILGADPGPVLELDARLGLAIAHVYSNELEAAEGDLHAVLGTPAARASMLVSVNARCYLAERHFRIGRWPAALDLAEATASIVDDADQVWLSALPHGIAASLLAFAGEHERAREHAGVALETAQLTGLLPARLWAAHAELRIAIAAADHERVAAQCDRMLAEGWEMYPEWVHRWRASAVESLLARERVDDAMALARGLREEAEAGTDLAAAADRARADGALAAATGDDVEAERLYAGGLALDPERSRPLERARLELAAGAHMRRRGRRREAAALLEAAAERLRRLGARPWIERCERELAACGLHPAKRSEPGAGADLTPQERLVARLVATGLTNREAADELVLSEKTIEHHLSRIYRKLGIRSRTELAAHLASAAP